MNKDVRGHLWPVYLVADESDSMHPYIDELNAGLSSINRALLGEPMTAAKVRFSLVGFSSDVVVRAHLLDLRENDEIAPISTRDRTCYGTVFSKLREMIPPDVAKLKQQQYAVYRPTVFFLSDGVPTDQDTWPAAHRDLTDQAVTREAPNVIACGIGEARRDIIQQVATKPQFAFVATPGVDIGKAIAAFFTSLTHSIVASTRSDRLIFEPPPGFEVPIDLPEM